MLCPLPKPGRRDARGTGIWVLPGKGKECPDTSKSGHCPRLVLAHSCSYILETPFLTHFGLSRANQATPMPEALHRDPPRSRAGATVPHVTAYLPLIPCYEACPGQAGRAARRPHLIAGLVFPHSKIAVLLFS